jgi:hypothetical protein
VRVGRVEQALGSGERSNRFAVGRVALVVVLGETLYLGLAFGPVKSERYHSIVRFVCRCIVDKF